MHLRRPRGTSRRSCGADFALSAQQFAAITAPLEPAVVIAGAGSGKTTLMAARVVWLVGTGQVRARRGARADLHDQGRRGARRPDPRGAPRRPASSSVARPAPADDEAEVLEPTVATYNAYAAALLTEHGLRIGHEPDTRVVADASRYQLAARVIDRHTREVEHLSDHPPTVIQQPAGARRPAERAPALARRAARLRRRGPRVRPGDRGRASGKDRRATASRWRRPSSPSTGAWSCSTSSRSTAPSSADLGLMEFSDQIELGARLAADRPEVGGRSAAKFKVVLLDEYQDTSVAQALMLSHLFSGPTRSPAAGTR